jgi:hypothetical protein
MAMTLPASLALHMVISQARGADLPDAGVPDEARLAIALGAGYQVFELPRLPVGILASGSGDFDSDTHVTAGGVSFGFAFGGQLGDTPYSLELSGGYARMSGDDQAVQAFDGAGSVFIVGPANITRGSLELTTATGPGGSSAQAQALAVDPTGNTAIINQQTASPVGGSTANLAFSPTADGGALTGVATNGSTPDAIAFGALADSGQYALGAVGNLDGLNFVTQQSEDVTMGTVELRFGRSFGLGDGWAFTPVVGPSYRRIERDIETTTTLAITPGSAAVGRFPDVSVSQIEDLTADYYGGLVGMTFSGPVANRVFLNFGGDFGVASYRAKYDGEGRAIIANVLDSGSVSGASQSESETTYFGRAKAGITVVEGRAALTLGVQAEYLADVPTLSRPSFEGLTYSQAAASLAGTSGSATSSLASDDMWSYGANVGLVVRF